MSETQAPSLILASQSPRRHELLRQMGVSFLARPADIDESLRPNESPDEYVLRMAREKASVIATRAEIPNLWVLGSDTTVVCDEQILGKPEDRAEARAMLNQLNGRRHAVLSAVALVRGETQHAAYERTEVQFAELEPAVIERYLDLDEPYDKAGAYGLQGAGGALVAAVHGSYSNVIGLPMLLTRQLLDTCRVPHALSPIGEEA